MVLRLATVSGDGAEVALNRRGKACFLVSLLSCTGHLVESVLRVETSFNALRERNLLLSIEQSNLTYLLQIRTDRVRRCGELSVLAGLAKCSRFLDIPDRRSVVFLVFFFLVVITKMLVKFFVIFFSRQRVEVLLLVRIVERFVRFFQRGVVAGDLISCG